MITITITMKPRKETFQQHKIHLFLFLSLCLLFTLSAIVQPARSIPDNNKTEYIQYVAPDGHDHNDGLSWRTAKQTILAAYDALPNEDPVTGFGGGSIYFANGSRIGGSISDQGLWILGPKDPNWHHPPAGWRKQKPLMLIGMPAHSVTNAPGMPQAWLQGGSSTDPQKPTIWISGNNRPIHFENISIQYPAVAIRLGVEANGRRDVDTSTVSFHNVGAQLNNVVGNGPTVDIGYAYWIWFTRCAFSANAAEPLSSDKRAAILVKPSQWAANLLTISDTIFNDGNFKYYTGINSWGFTMRNVVFEGDFTNPIPPAVQILNANQYGSAFIENITVADAPGTEADIKIEGNDVQAENVVVVNAYPGTISGPATIINRYPTNWQNVTKNPSGSGQVGFWRGRISGQHDSARRTFGPVAVRFPNLVNQDPQAWASIPGNPNVTITTGISAPDGTNRAGRLATTLIEIQEREIFRSNRRFDVGDFIIAGFWVRAASQNGFLAAGPGQVNIPSSNLKFSNNSSSLTMIAPLKGDGEWEWISIFGKITQVGSPNTSDIVFYFRGNSSHPHDFYAPILLHIPAATISDNEAAEIALHMASWPNGVEPGSVALLQGQKFVFAPDTNLYRPATQAQAVKTDGKLIAAGGLGVGNSVPATMAGNLVSGIEIFDANGKPLGFVPVYDAVMNSAAAAATSFQKIDAVRAKKLKLALPPGDINKDGAVNIFDIVTVIRNFDQTIISPSPAESNPDINADGKVDIFDLITVVNHLGEPVKPIAEAVRDFTPQAVTSSYALSNSNIDIDINSLIQLRDLLKAISNPNQGISKSIAELDRLISSRLMSKNKSRSELLSETGSKPVVVKETKLLPNYPNPFNPETWIPYQLANSAEVRIRIYDVSGRIVRTLNLGRQDAGLYLTKGRAAYWDGRNEFGERVSSGIYFYEFAAGKFRSVKKMIITK